jgi:hypothetical protein
LVPLPRRSALDPNSVTLIALGPHPPSSQARGGESAKVAVRGLYVIDRWSSKIDRNV